MGKVVTLTGATLSGGDTGNYVLGLGGDRYGQYHAGVFDDHRYQRNEDLWRYLYS